MQSKPKIETFFIHQLLKSAETLCSKKKRIQATKCLKSRASTKSEFFQIFLRHFPIAHEWGIILKYNLNIWDMIWNKLAISELEGVRWEDSNLCLPRTLLRTTLGETISPRTFLLSFLHVVKMGGRRKIKLLRARASPWWEIIKPTFTLSLLKTSDFISKDIGRRQQRHTQKKGWW